MPEFDPAVEYRDIPGFPGYKAGSDGTIWTSRKKKRGECGAIYRQLRPSLGGRGYLKVNISDGESLRCCQVHRLVLLAFVGPCPEGMEGCHDPDPTKTNCQLGNLRWDTNSANKADRIKHGTSPDGERAPATSLKNTDIIEIRKRLQAGEKGVTIAARYRVSQTSISRIKLARTWRRM